MEGVHELVEEGAEVWHCWCWGAGDGVAVGDAVGAGGGANGAEPCGTDGGGR